MSKASSIKVGSINAKKDGDGHYLKVDKYTTVTISRANKDGTKAEVVVSGGEFINLFKNDGSQPEFVKYDVVAYPKA